MKMNMQKWVADVIRQKEVTAVPVMTHPGIELNGHTVREAVSDGRVHYEAVMTLVRKYPSAAACTIMDLTTEAEEHLQVTGAVVVGRTYSAIFESQSASGS